MWPDRVSNPGPLTYESGVLPTALRGPAPPTGGQTVVIIIRYYMPVYHPESNEAFKIPKHCYCATENKWLKTLKRITCLSVLLLLSATVQIQGYRVK